MPHFTKKCPVLRFDPAGLELSRSFPTERGTTTNTTLRSARLGAFVCNTRRLMGRHPHAKVSGYQQGGRRCSLLVWLRTRLKEMTNRRILFLRLTTLRTRTIRLSIRRLLTYHPFQRPILRQRRRGVGRAALASGISQKVADTVLCGFPSLPTAGSGSSVSHVNGSHRLSRPNRTRLIMVFCPSKRCVSASHSYTCTR